MLAFVCKEMQKVINCITVYIRKRLETSQISCKNSFQLNDLKICTLVSRRMKYSERIHKKMTTPYSTEGLSSVSPGVMQCGPSQGLLVWEPGGWGTEAVG